jgi:hypothetical protein
VHIVAAAPVVIAAAVAAVDRAVAAEGIPAVAANSDCFAFPLKRP